MAKTLPSELKKKVIISLLAISCLIAGIMLAFTTNEPTPQLRSFAEADTIIVDELTQFNIKDQQIERYPIHVDSNFTRWVYRVNVSPHLSKTHLHTSLHDRLNELEVNTPARIYFPGKEMDIHLNYNNTIIRTIELKNDTTLALEKRGAHVIVYSDDPPAPNIFDSIIKFGEPIPLVIQMDEEEMDELDQMIESRIGGYEHIAYWPGHKVPGATPEKSSLNKVELQQKRQFLGQLMQRHEQGKLLYIDGMLPFSLQDIRNTLSQHDGRVYSVDRPLILEEEAGTATYQQTILEFQREVFNGESPTLLVEANSDHLNELHKTILKLKKQGLYIRPPELKSY